MSYTKEYKLRRKLGFRPTGVIEVTNPGARKEDIVHLVHYVADLNSLVKNPPTKWQKKGLRGILGSTTRKFIKHVRRTGVFPVATQSASI